MVYKMKKKLFSWLLALAMLFSLAPSVLAADSAALSAANELHALGLFNGTGTNADGSPNYDLDRVPTRAEAVTMLVRLLGKEDEAKNGTWSTPFTDVPDWAKPYVGYAYANQLTNGISGTAFGSSASVTAAQYLTFTLRALGYDSSIDFTWDKAWELSDQLGITNGQYNASCSFTRGDVAVISASALDQTLKGTQQTLRDLLDAPAAGLPTEEDIANAHSPSSQVCINGVSYTSSQLDADNGTPLSIGLKYARIIDGEVYACFKFLTFSDPNVFYCEFYGLPSYFALADGTYEVGLAGFDGGEYIYAYITLLSYERTSLNGSQTYDAYSFDLFGKPFSVPQSPVTGSFVSETGIRCVGMKDGSSGNVIYYMNVNDMLDYVGINGYYSYENNVLIFES